MFRGPRYARTMADDGSREEAPRDDDVRRDAPHDDTTAIPVADDEFRQDVTEDVPVALRVAAAWAWRILVVGVVLIALGQVIGRLWPVVLPLLVAALIAAPLERVVSVMHDKASIPRSLGSAVSILALFAAIVGLATAAGTQVVSGFDQLRESALAGFDQAVEWLVDGPLHVSREQIQQVADQVVSTVQDNAWGLATGAVNVTGTLSALVAGILLAVISLFFFLRDGAQMWRFAVGLVPRRGRASIDRAGQLGWSALSSYTRTIVFVAFIDAVGIGLGAWILGLPLALPIAIAVFLFSFIPIFGAGISGAIAVLVALVDGGLTTAVWMLIIVLVVQQVEGNVLYPWLFGKAAAVHPLAILLAVSGGTLLAGLAGAVIAVPILTFVVVFGRGLHKEYMLTRGEPPITGQIPLLADKSKQALRRVRERVSTSQIKVRGGSKRRRRRL